MSAKIKKIMPTQIKKIKPINKSLKQTAPANPTEVVIKSPEIASKKEQNAELQTKIDVAGGSKYDTVDNETYQNRLDGFTMMELQEEALRAGLKPLGDRAQTTRTLIELFNEWRRQYLYTPGTSTVNSGLSAETKAELTRLMRDGR